MSKASQQFLKNLSVVMSLPGLTFNEDRVCCLSDPGALDIQMEWLPERGRLMVIAAVGTLGDDPKLARTLLSANFLFAGTRGESLSLESGTDRVFLCAGFDLDEISEQHAIELFSRFIDTARQWVGFLSGQSELPEHVMPPSSFIRV
jgi:hypothetical protein